LRFPNVEDLKLEELGRRKELRKEWYAYMNHIAIRITIWAVETSSVLRYRLEPITYLAEVLPVYKPGSYLILF
jgi:hypothetical protein